MAWKEYKNTGYFVSDTGVVLGVKHGKPLGYELNNAGYPRVTLYYNGKRVRHTIHRLVWTVFNGTIPKNKVVDHIDDDKTNFNLSNLQLLTQAKNTKKGWFVRRSNYYSWHPNKQAA